MTIYKQITSEEAKTLGDNFQFRFRFKDQSVSGWLEGQDGLSFESRTQIKSVLVNDVKLTKSEAKKLYEGTRDTHDWFIGNNKSPVKPDNLVFDCGYYSYKPKESSVLVNNEMITVTAAKELFERTRSTHDWFIGDSSEPTSLLSLSFNTSSYRYALKTLLTLNDENVSVQTAQTLIMHCVDSHDLFYSRHGSRWVQVPITEEKIFVGSKIGKYELRGKKDLVSLNGLMVSRETAFRKYQQFKGTRELWLTRGESYIRITDRHITKSDDFIPQHGGDYLFSKEPFVRVNGLLMTDKAAMELYKKDTTQKIFARNTVGGDWVDITEYKNTNFDSLSSRNVEYELRESLKEIPWDDWAIGAKILTGSPFVGEFRGINRNFIHKEVRHFGSRIIGNDYNRKEVTLAHRDEQEWILWVGGERTIPEGVLVDVEFFSGNIVRGHQSIYWDWKHDAGIINRNDIKQYKIVGVADGYKLV